MAESHSYLYCEKHHYPYFEDYIKTFIDKLGLILVIVDSVNLIGYGQTDTYFFISKIPQCVLAGNPIKAIYINMEQLTRRCFLDYVQVIKSRNIPIFNYNETNQQIIPESLLLRYQYLPEEVAILSSHPVEKTYDVAFVGLLSQKRALILNQLKGAGLRVVNIEGWGSKRDQEILQAKILVNIHYDNEYNIYESLRCDRLIFGRMIVITETSIHQELLDIKEFFISVEYSELVAKVQEVLANYQYYIERLTSSREKLLPSIIESRQTDLLQIKSLMLKLQ